MADETKAPVETAPTEEAPTKEVPGGGEPAQAPEQKPLSPAESIAALRDSLDDGAKRLIAQELLGPEYVRDTFSKDLEREAQRMAERREASNQLDLDRRNIADRYAERAVALERQLSEVEGADRVLRDAREVFEGNANDTRRAEFQHAVRSLSIYPDLTEDERRQIGGVQDGRPEMFEVTLRTLLAAQERVAKDGASQTAEKAAAEKVGLAEALAKFGEFVKASQEETSSEGVSTGPAITTLAEAEAAFNRGEITREQLREWYKKTAGYERMVR